MATAKNYTTFPAGTYDTSKIFLQADPATGELEKINLPAIPTGQNRLKIFYTDEANTGGVNKTYNSYTMPANTLVNDGDQITVQFFFEVVGDAVAKSIVVFFDSTSFTFSLSGSATYGYFKMVITRVNSTTYLREYQNIIGQPFALSCGYSSTSVDWTTAIPIKATCNTTNSNAVISKSCTIDYTPAA